MKPVLNECSGCRFCCWSWAIEFPTQLKKALAHCQHECDKGCSVHGKPERPEVCGAFHCPYQEREGLHRPDTFQDTLEFLGGDIGNYIPVIPTSIPIDVAKDLIVKTRTLPAAVINGGQWVDVILPLDRDEHGGWVTADPTPWNL